MFALIDHKDSFTDNLAHLMAGAGARTRVVAAASDGLAGLEFEGLEGVVLSPGPGHPAEAKSTLALLGRLPESLPVLGVCLGHQLLCMSQGAQVERCTPMHGRVSRLHHTAGGLFAQCEPGLRVARYHSWAVAEEALGSCWHVDARADGVVMAVRHRRRPWFGLQFHPESFMTAGGAQLAAEFVRVARAQVSPSSRNNAHG